MSYALEILHDGTPNQQLAGASLVEVVEEVGSCTSYCLHYGFNIQNGDFEALTYDWLGPESEISIRVRDVGPPTVLVRGPVTEQDIGVRTGGDGSTLAVHGADVTVTMGREWRVRTWSSTTDAAACTSILGDY